MDKLEVPCWAPSHLTSLSRNNHDIAAQKFGLLRELLRLDYSCLFVDTDVVVLQNPFEHLYRDADLEAGTDGFDNNTAYGWSDDVEDESMGWAKHAQRINILALNSGLFFMRANEVSLALLDTIMARLATHPKAWDQSVFNEAIWLPSHNEYNNPHIRVRVMDFVLFMNSKTLFKYIRKNEHYAGVLPVVVHLNYHPDKWERMKAVVDFYHNGNLIALDAFPDGSCWNLPCT